MTWDDEAATWDDDPTVRAYSEAAHGSLRALLADRGASLSGARVFDFGCGTGLLTARIAAEAGHVVGLDISPKMVDVLRAKALSNGVALCGSLEDHIGGEHLPVGEFDLVTCSSVCAFLDDYPATAQTLARLLAPGGLFVQWDWELMPDAPEPMGLTRAGIEQALRGAGLGSVVVDVGFDLPYEGFVMAPLRGIGIKPRA